jgi:hypothetical protein
MRKYILFLVFPFLCLKPLSAQIGISVMEGYGKYAMDDLKTLQHSYLVNLPVNAEIVNNFPARPFPEIKVFYFLKILSAGLTYSFHSTGSKVNYKDYSGEINYTQITNLNAFGQFVRLRFLNVKHMRASLSFQTNLAYTNLKLSQTVQIFDENASEAYKLKAFSIFGEPGLDVIFPFKNFEIGLFGGYCIDTKGEFYLNNDASMHITLPDNKNARTNWSGYRIGIMLNYLLNFKKS